MFAPHRDYEPRWSLGIAVVLTHCTTATKPPLTPLLPCKFPCFSSGAPETWHTGVSEPTCQALAAEGLSPAQVPPPGLQVFSLPGRVQQVRSQPTITVSPPLCIKNLPQAHQCSPWAVLIQTGSHARVRRFGSFCLACHDSARGRDGWPQTEVLERGGHRTVVPGNQGHRKWSSKAKKTQLK